MKNQIHTFQIQGEIQALDLEVLKDSVLKYLESDPLFVVVDLSQTLSLVPEIDLQKQLSEIKAFAQAKNLSLIIAQSDIESMHAHQRVVELALQKKMQILENKIELRRQMNDDAVRLRNENEHLRKSLEEQVLSNPFQHKLSPFAEKLWREES